MLTLGTGRTCIILRHIPSWFEAVLAIAIRQSCAQRCPKWPFWGQKWPNMAGLPMSQSGLRGPKMIPNDQYNMFLTIWGHFGIIWTLFDHFTQNLIFCPENTKCFLAKVIWSQNQVLSEMIPKSPNGPKMAPNGQKYVKLIILDPRRLLWDISNPAMFSHFWPKKGFFGPPAHMIEGWQGPKLLQTNLIYV